MSASCLSKAIAFHMVIVLSWVVVPGVRGGTPEQYDLNGDGVVTAVDILSLVDVINASGGQSLEWDLDNSGQVDQRDVDLFVGGIQSHMTRTKKSIPKSSSASPQIVAVLTPSAAGPYAPGQQVPIVVSLQRALPGVPLRARLIQFDAALTNSNLGLTYPVTYADTLNGPIWFWDFSSTPFCMADSMACGTNHYIDPNQHLPFDNIVVIVYFGLSPNSSMQITIPADGTPVVVGHLDVTLPQAPGVYRLDLMNAINTDVNYGAQFYSGFGIPSDPLYVIYRAGTGEFAGGILDLPVGVDECVSGASCLDDGLVCTDDVCLDGICQHPPKASGSLCGSSVLEGICDQPDACDGAGICGPNYASGTVCREPVGECDVVDLCNGQSPLCLPDVQAAAGTPCGNQTPLGACDRPDVCNGFGACLPNLAGSSVVCRPANDDCDQVDYCSGHSSDCGPDTFAQEGTPCGNPAPIGACDLPDQCDGAGVCSPHFASSQTPCRPAATECDVEEFCTGQSSFCPGDSLREVGTPCSDDGDECTDDTCDELGQCTHIAIPGCRSIPALSIWGLLAMFLLLAIGAKLRFGVRSMS